MRRLRNPVKPGGGREAAQQGCGSGSPFGNKGHPRRCLTVAFEDQRVVQDPLSLENWAERVGASYTLSKKFR